MGNKNKNVDVIVTVSEHNGRIEMALLEDAIKGGGLIPVLIIGLGATVVAPVVLPLLRPIAKTVIKTGFIAFNQAQVALREIQEQTEDIVAEARSELSEPSKPPATPQPETGL